MIAGRAYFWVSRRWWVSTIDVVAASHDELFSFSFSLLLFCSHAQRVPQLASAGGGVVGSQSMGLSFCAHLDEEEKGFGSSV
ncbi:hypothetical protein LX32DRAFT_420048 [Colletotrichum zoysiae]|uniref:Uncharacterized protein n=1 Tax=Colletotrichum zoysiae TaxID=1216348 RepID=A0AAD9M9T8_9PEZI|nr:hypothetical protein LX32DRAFT_420048 [Colletotrichum zoysiae]